MKPCLTSSIVLGPTGNTQGTYKFMSLMTGKKIKHRFWTEYPVPNSVLKRVGQLARRDGNLGDLKVADHHGILFEWNDK